MSSSADESVAAAANAETASGCLESYLTMEDRVCRPIIRGRGYDGPRRIVCGPGTLVDSGPEHVELAFSMAREAPVLDAPQRAAVLERAGESLFAQRMALVALLVLASEHSIPSAFAEVRRACGLCTTFGALGREYFVKPVRLPGPTGESNELSFVRRVTFAALSGGHRPLSGFVGQIAAAFAAGNAVLAKPSDDTALVASLAFRLVLEAGIPNLAIAFLPGAAAEVGARLITHRHCDGVSVHGSAESVSAVNRAVAAREGPILPVIVDVGGYPEYLFRFAYERTVTVNTTAAGGNASLMVDSA